MCYEEQVVNLINEERMNVGLHPLMLNSKLSSIAQTKSEDMHINKYFNHTSPIFGSSFDMLNKSAIQYSYAAENIAKGQTTAKTGCCAKSIGPRTKMCNFPQKFQRVSFLLQRIGLYFSFIFCRRLPKNKNICCGYLNSLP